MRVLMLLLTCGIVLHAAVGPTPFPDPKDATAWPGAGPIRVHPWMTDNRNAFWGRREQDRGAVIFVGDSLTGGWKNLAQSFPGLRVANRGIGGDVSRGVLFRLREDVLDLQPRAIVLCIGANDLSAHGQPKDTAANIAAIIAQARSADATMPIVLCTTPPRDAPKAPTKPGAQADLNARILALGQGQPHLAALDLYAPLADADGKPLADCFAADRLHLAAPGYAVWARELAPVLERLGVR